MEFSRFLTPTFKKIYKQDIIVLYSYLNEVFNSMSLNIIFSINIEDNRDKIETKYNTLSDFNEAILLDHHFDTFTLMIQGKGPGKEDHLVYIHYIRFSRWVGISITGASRAWVDHVSKSIELLYGKFGTDNGERFAPPVYTPPDQHPSKEDNNIETNVITGSDVIENDEEVVYKKRTIRIGHTQIIIGLVAIVVSIILAMFFK